MRQVRTAKGKRAVCNDPWIGSCQDFGLGTVAATYGSYLSIGGGKNKDGLVGAKDYGSINVKGAQWNKDNALKVDSGAIYWSSPSKGCQGKCQMARLTVPAGSRFVARANMQGHKTKYFDSAKAGSGVQHDATAWSVRVTFSTMAFNATSGKMVQTKNLRREFDTPGGTKVAVEGLTRLPFWRFAFLNIDPGLFGL